MKLLRILALIAVIGLAASSAALAGTKTVQHLRDRDQTNPQQQDRVRDCDGTCDGLPDRTQARGQLKTHDFVAIAEDSVDRVQARDRDRDGSCDCTAGMDRTRTQTQARKPDGAGSGGGGSGFDGGGGH